MSKKQGCRRIQSIKGEMSCCCVALAQCNTCYTLPGNELHHFCRVMEPRECLQAVWGPAPPPQQFPAFRPGPGEWELALASLWKQWGYLICLEWIFCWAKLANSRCFLLQPDALADAWFAMLTVISMYVLALHLQRHHWGKSRRGAGDCSNRCHVRDKRGTRTSPLMQRWKTRNSQGSEGNPEVSLRFWNLLPPLRPV